MNVEDATWLFKEIVVGEDLECSIIYRHGDCHLLMYNEAWDEKALERVKAIAHRAKLHADFGFNVLLVR